MTPGELRAIRESLGLSLAEMGRLLGYTGTHRKAQMHRLETGERPINDAQRRLAEAYEAGYRPADWPE